ncbi:hypothetical protein SDC9_185647 [bioreactor metagenome]|uniref:Uncharacterized protein n=1 Tax=bioreactor metagenome TaxID=1076179 RepID=A0A645HRW6_9ZZZZ
MEAHELRRVVKIESQEIRQKKAAEVLAAACDIVLACAGDDVLLDRGKLRSDVGLQPKLGFNGDVTLRNLAVGFVKRKPVGVFRIAKIQQVGDLFVAGKAFARRRRHDVFARRIGLDDVFHLRKVLCVAKARSAKFYRLNRH